MAKKREVELGPPPTPAPAPTPEKVGTFEEWLKKTHPDSYRLWDGGGAYTIGKQMLVNEYRQAGGDVGTVFALTQKRAQEGQQPKPTAPTPKTAAAPPPPQPGSVIPGTESIGGVTYSELQGFPPKPDPSIPDWVWVQLVKAGANPESQTQFAKYLKQQAESQFPDSKAQQNVWMEQQWTTQANAQTEEWLRTQYGVSNVIAGAEVVLYPGGMYPAATHEGKASPWAGVTARASTIGELLREPNEPNWDKDQILELQRKLQKGNPITNTNVTTTGIYDDETIKAYRTVLLQASRERRTPEEVMADNARGAKSLLEKGGYVKAPFAAPPKVNEDPEAIKLDITQVFREQTGRNPTPKELSALMGVYRKYENRKYLETDTPLARYQHDVSQSNQQYQYESSLRTRMGMAAPGRPSHGAAPAVTDWDPAAETAASVQDVSPAAVGEQDLRQALEGFMAAIREQM